MAAAGQSVKVTVTIKHVTWRDGRPRFIPGPDVRALGFKSFDLKHDDGRWFDLEECASFSNSKVPEIAAARAANTAAQAASNKRQRKPLPHNSPRPSRLAAYTIANMAADMFRAAKFSRPRHDGGLSPKTIADYHKKLARLEDICPELWTSAASAVNAPIIIGVHERIWNETSANNAKAIIAVLSAAFDVAVRRGRVPFNPCHRLKLEGQAARVRYGTPAEIDALIKAADTLEPQIGDAIFIALHTFQRQGDVLALVEDQRSGNGARLRFCQSKTGKVVEPRISPQLLERLDQAARRKRMGGFASSPQIVIDPRTGGRYNEYLFRKRFAAIRALGAQTCPSLADFKFQDLRDTAITRAALAEWTLMQICAYSGHSPSSVQTILKSYVQLMHAIADAGADKLEAWMQDEGIAV